METHISLTPPAERWPNEPLVCNSALRGIHALLLSECSLEDVREFWRPAREWFADASEADFYRHLWNERAASPGDVLSRAIHGIDRLWCARGKDIEAAIAELHLHMNQGSWVRAGVLLGRVHKALPDLCAAKDPHRALLGVIAANCELEFVGARTHFGEVNAADGVNTVYGAVGPDPRSNRSVPYDGNLVASRLLQALPRAFGLPPFEEPVLHVADCREPSMAVWDETIELRGRTLRMNGRTIGESISFESFLDTIGLTPPPWDLEVKPVLLVHEDYVCPRRRRVVLHGGCVYGAPYYVCRFRWRPSCPVPEGYLCALAADLEGPASNESATLEARQAALIAEAERRVVLEYRVARQSISVGDRILFSGTPARILRHILRRYAGEGTEVFEFRDFKYDPEITHNPKQSGFEQRLSRIRAKLAETEFMRIDPAGRGRLRFTSLLPLSFVERD